MNVASTCIPAPPTLSRVQLLHVAMLGNASSNSSSAALHESLAAIYSVRVGVGIASTLSIFGATVIILSYAAFPQLRTTARQLLLNLSVAHFIVVLMYIGGLVENAGSIHEEYKDDRANGTIPYWLCKAQAAVLVYATDASILWTISIGIYFFVVVFWESLAVGKRITLLFYIFSWGTPLVVVVWLLASGLLGYESGSDPAFCGILGIVQSSSSGEDTRVIYPIIAGYEVWNYIAFLTLPVLYFATKCREKRLLCHKVKEDQFSEEQELKMSFSLLSSMPDRAIIRVPLVFMMLRLWSLVLDIGIYYVPQHAKSHYRQDPASATMVFLEGVCNTLPGFVNGLLFCVFTRVVRQTMLSGFKQFITCRNCASFVRHRQQERELINTANSQAASYGSILTEEDIVHAPDPASFRPAT